MNKKSLIASIAVLIGVIFFAGFANAQVCVPDPQFTQPGIYPDSATGVYQATVGECYEQVLTVVVPLDTTDPSGFCSCGVDIDSIGLNGPGIGGLPPGLSYTCSTPSCYWQGGSNGCVLISGTPTDTGDFYITAYIRAKVVCNIMLIFCTPFDTASYDTIDYYHIVVNPAPVAFDDTVTTDQDVSVVIDVQSNDIGGDPLVTTILTGPANGIADTLNGDSIGYTPNLGFIGADSIVYMICNNGSPTLCPPPVCDTAVVNITVQPVCSATIANFIFITSNLTADFTDSSAGADLNWAWDFGDGSPVNNTQNPTHTYTADSAYTVCLIVTDSCGADTICQNVTVSCPVPTAGFSFTTSNLTASFIDASSGAVSWAWDFGDGTGTSTAQDTTYTYSTDSTYNVCLTVTNSCGNIDTLCDSVTVASGFCSPPVANFTFTDNNLTVNFTDASTGADLSWTWDFGDGSIDSTTQNPTHIYTADNTYNVCLTVTDSCGSDSTCKNVTVTDTTTGISPGHAGLALGSVKVYPNPANDLLIVEINDLNNSSYDVELYDHMGRLVRNYQDQSSGKLKINRKNLNTGLYFLRVKTAQGIYSNKIVFE
ncbi:MAG: PKD domain-containing protein [Cytophagales bacterium]|nr:PKD domain-containing protein [Cytophagales bacterium]